MKEIWKPIPFLNGRYEVSDHGRIRRAIAGKRTRIGRVRALQKNRNGYLHCVVCVGPTGKPKDLRVHIAVAYAFLGAPVGDKRYVNHKDGDKTNNRPGNLEWCTFRENILHARKMGLIDDRKPVDQYTKDGKKFIAHYASIAEASRFTGIPAEAISTCCIGMKSYVSRVKTVKGFLWRKDARGVLQFDKAGQLIAIYGNYEGAARAVGSHNPGAIMQCTTGKEYAVHTRVYTARGYHWEFSPKGDSQCQVRE